MWTLSVKAALALSGLKIPGQCPYCALFGPCLPQVQWLDGYLVVPAAGSLYRLVLRECVF